MQKPALAIIRVIPCEIDSGATLYIEDAMLDRDAPNIRPRNTHDSIVESDALNEDAIGLRGRGDAETRIQGTSRLEVYIRETDIVCLGAGIDSERQECLRARRRASQERALGGGL